LLLAKPFISDGGVKTALLAVKTGFGRAICWEHDSGGRVKGTALEVDHEGRRSMDEADVVA
jgi:hypothetical protein